MSRCASGSGVKFLFPEDSTSNETKIMYSTKAFTVLCTSNGTTSFLPSGTASCDLKNIKL